MTGDFSDDLKVKEFTVSKIWAGGAKAGDETAADITCASTAAGSTIIFGRQSATSNNNTVVSFRNRLSTGSLYINPNGSIGVSDTAVIASLASSVIAQFDSTTKALVLPRLTTTQRDAVSSPLSGSIVFNVTTRKLNVYTGSGWEAVTST